MPDPLVTGNATGKRESFDSLSAVRGTSLLPLPTAQSGYSMGGREGERAEQPKVPAMRSIVGMAAEGGAVHARERVKQNPPRLADHLTPH